MKMSTKAYILIASKISKCHFFGACHHYSVISSYAFNDLYGSESLSRFRQPRPQHLQRPPATTAQGGDERQPCDIGCYNL